MKKIIILATGLIMIANMAHAKLTDGSSPKVAPSNIIKYIEPTGESDGAPPTTPSCGEGDMSGAVTTNSVTTCCKYGQDGDGRSVCIGFETCDVKTIHCLGMGNNSGGNYDVNGDPGNCERDAACDEVSTGTHEAETFQTP